MRLNSGPWICQSDTLDTLSHSFSPFCVGWDRVLLYAQVSLNCDPTICASPHRQYDRLALLCQATGWPRISRTFSSGWSGTEILLVSPSQLARIQASTTVPSFKTFWQGKTNNFIVYSKYFKTVSMAVSISKIFSEGRATSYS